MEGNIEKMVKLTMVGGLGCEKGGDGLLMQCENMKGELVENSLGDLIVVWLCWGVVWFG